MNESPKPTQASNETTEDLNLLATKEFHQLLETDTTLLPTWKTAALKLSEKDVPENIDALKKLLEAEKNADPKTTQS
jgi:HEAT repeat protein